MLRDEIFRMLTQERVAQQKAHSFNGKRLTERDLRVYKLITRTFGEDLEGFSVGQSTNVPINTVQLVDPTKRTLRLARPMTYHQNPLWLIPPDFLYGLYVYFREHPDEESPTHWQNLGHDPNRFPTPRSVFSDTDRCSFIWGPPGTGKTYTLARRIAQHYLENRQPMLITSIANLAVDQLFVETINALHEEGFADWERILRPHFIDPTALARLNSGIDLPFLEEIRKRNQSIAILKQKLLKEEEPSRRLDLLEQIRTIRSEFEAKLKNRMQKADLLAASLTKLHFGREMRAQHSRFSSIAIDEAGFIPLIHAYYWGLQPTIRQIFLAGDPQQLGPISSCSYKSYTTEIKRWILQSPFDVQSSNAKEKRFFLNQQRRMHPNIGNYISQTFYHSRLKNHRSVQTRPEQRPLGLFSEMVLLDTHYKPANPVEHERWSQNKVTDIDERMTLFGVKSRSKLKTATPHNLGSANISMCLALLALKANPNCTIGVVTRFRKQRRILFKMLEYIYEREKQRFWGFSLNDAKRQITTSTIHRMQGGERDLILIDLVVGLPYFLRGVDDTNENWKSEERLINVSVSRARHQVVVLTNAYYTLRVGSTSNPFVKRFAESAESIRMTKRLWRTLED